MTKPVCERCKDTHTMTFHTGSGDERQVPCTFCPTPCESCRGRYRQGGASAYCAKTPCDCECHLPRSRSAPKGKLRSTGERARVLHYLDLLESTVKGVRIAVEDARTPVGTQTAQSIAEMATLLAMGIAKLDAYQLQGHGDADCASSTMPSKGARRSATIVE